MWPSGEAYDLFLDQGKPILRGCAVAYLDILGIRNLSTAPERLEVLRRLISSLDIAREEAMLEGQESWQALSWFTDNVVVAFPILPGHIDEEPALGSALRAATYIQLRGFPSPRRSCLRRDPHGTERRLRPGADRSGRA